MNLDTVRAGEKVTPNINAVGKNKCLVLKYAAFYSDVEFKKSVLCDTF